MLNNKSSPSQSEGSAGEIDIGRLIGTLLDHKWLILALTTFFAIAGILYTIFATPIYQADALVQVEDNFGNQLMNNMDALLPSAKPESAAEIELIQSRMVVGKTVDDLGLSVNVQEKLFPIFGKGWQRLTNAESSDIAISRLEVPNEWYNQPFQLQVLDKTHYNLSIDGRKVLSGQVAQRASNDTVSILVSDISAKPDTVFNVTKNSELSVIEGIRNNLTALDSGKDTGVLTLTFTGPDPVLAQKTLAGITNNYLLQNVERKSEEAEKSLEFLETEVPQSRSTLDVAEDKLNFYRQQNDSVDLSLEAKSLLDTLVNIDSQLNELTFKEAEISKLYTKEHPAYRTLLEQRQTLENQKIQLNKRIASMPKTQQEILRLTRDVQVGQEVYMQLVNKQQELRISKASTVGNVRIVDSAVTLPGTVKPQKLLIIVGSILLGFIVSVICVIIKTILHRGIENPAELEESGINVYATIPLSEWQQKKDRELFNKRSKQKAKGELLVISNPTDPAIEAVRSLRTSLHFAMSETKNNALMISGASPAIGKTFVSTNLSALITQTGQKVLFIDGDLRKGYVHDLLSLKNSSGLSELLSKQAEVEACIQHAAQAGFDVITRGRIAPNPSELLMSDRFGSLIGWAQKNYDIVIIDTPPILAVTDAAIIGQHVGTALLVVRYGINTLRETQISINRFEQNNIHIKGVILNSVFKKASNYYSEYGHYDYQYESTKES